jgi:hypothetical protein
LQGNQTLHCIPAAIFSVIIVEKLVLAQGTTGKIEASTMRKPCTPGRGLGCRRRAAPIPGSESLKSGEIQIAPAR